MLAVASVAFCGGVARAQQIAEFPVPSPASQPLGIVAGPDGAVWFTEDAGNRIGRMTTDGAVTEYAIPTAASHPSRIARGPDGALWFTEFGGNKIGRITTGGAITEFPVPTQRSFPLGITAGPDGNIWFTETAGHKIGRITPAGAVTEFPVAPLDVIPADPYSIVAGPDGALWFTESFTGRVGRITTEGVITHFRTEPTCCAILAEIAAGPDGNLWFVDRWDNKIGRIAPTGDITYFTGLGPGFGTTGVEDAYGIGAGADGALWFTEFASNQIGRITTEGVISEFAIPTSHSGADIIAPGPDGSLWFTETSANKIGRVSAGEHFPQECRLTSTALCLNAGRFRVAVDWRVPTQGTSGVGTAVPLTGDTGYFWFFSANNIELAIKVVDGRAFNGYFWVFYGALSDVEYAITVTDMMTGAKKIYSNSQGRLASVADTAAFAGSGPLAVLEPKVSSSDTRGRAADLVRTVSDVTFTEFPLPTASSLPNGIATGPDGALWFTESGANKIGRITTGGAVTEFPVQGTPFGITAGPDGAMWFTEPTAAKIGRITVAGAITEYPLAANSGPNQITRGADGALWFTDPTRNTIGRITTAGAFTEFAIPTPDTGVFGIAAGSDGNVWFTEQRGNSTTQGSQGAVGRITPAGAITEFRSSIREATPVGIISGPDGNLWFTEFNSNRIGRISPEGIVTESPRLPGEIRGEVALAAGPDGALWFLDDLVPYGKISRLTTSWNLSEFELPIAGVQSRGITSGPDGNIWFTDRGGNKIWRAAIGSSPAPCTTGSQNLCLNAERFRVEVNWRVLSQGTSGVGRAVSLTGDTGYFWFFSSNNVELVIKVVDGRAFNGHFWVFYGALSDVEYTVTVRDTLTGMSRTYTNTPGHLASVADAAAF